jgi:hypothetical protein
MKHVWISFFTVYLTNLYLNSCVAPINLTAIHCYCMVVVLPLEDRGKHHWLMHYVIHSESILFWLTCPLLSVFHSEVSFLLVIYGSIIVLVNSADWYVCIHDSVHK